MELLIFLISNYFLLIVFALSNYLIGSFIFDKISGKTKDEKYFVTTLKIILGLGIFILILFGLLLLGLFKLNIIFLIIFLIFLFQRKLTYQTFINIDCNFLDKIKKLSKINKFEIGLLVLLLFSVLPLIFKSLTLPKAWDELNYHLPHARSWAINGSLLVNDNYRYPWFPYNLNVLYSLGLILGSNVLPKIFHAYCGFLTGLLLFSFSNLFIKKNKIITYLSLIFWFFISRGMYEKAYIELGYTLFIFSSLLTLLYFLVKNPKPLFFLASAFFLGLSLGIKYQALFFIPAFIVFIPAIKKYLNMKVILFALICFLTPFIYWYLRNYLITGNPVNPIFAPFFGFYDWNEADYLHQFSKLSEKRHFNNSFLLTSVFFIFFINKFKDFKIIFLYCILTVSLWFIVSGYGRYLYPIFPLMCFFTAIVIYELYNFLKVRIYNLKFTKSITLEKVLVLFFFVLIILYSIDSVLRIKKSINLIPYSPEREQVLLKEEITGYECIKFLNQYKESKVFQIGFEDSIFYFENEVWGEVFGVGRYRDYLVMAPVDLSDSLKKMKIDFLIINTNKFPFLSTRYDFDKYFKFVYQNNGNEIYSLI